MPFMLVREVWGAKWQDIFLSVSPLFWHVLRMFLWLGAAATPSVRRLLAEAGFIAMLNPRINPPSRVV